MGHLQNQFGPALHTGLPEQPLEHRLDRLNRDEHPVSDLLIREATIG